MQQFPVKINIEGKGFLQRRLIFFWRRGRQCMKRFVFLLRRLNFIISKLFIILAVCGFSISFVEGAAVYIVKGNGGSCDWQSIADFFSSFSYDSFLELRAESWS